MKVVLAFGDSLTFGADAVNDARHAYEDRWPTVLEQGLGGAARVIPEGLGGRTTVFDDFAAAADRNGARLLPTLLGTHSPLDAIVIFLGTNDLKPFINGTALGAAMGVKRLVEIVRTYPYNRGAKVPGIVIVSPPLIVATEHPDLGPMLGDKIAESKLFAGYYRRIATALDCGFFDAASVATPGPVDGVHLDARNTRAIGEGLVPVVKAVLGL
jgi:lysophospholipase L1-like esterase